MNEFKNYSRMCKAYRKDCLECPISNVLNGKSLHCTDLIKSYPAEAAEIVNRWAAEHPVKTRKDVLLEKFPGAEMNEKGAPEACAKMLGLIEECGREAWNLDCCKDCWNTEVSD